MSNSKSEKKFKWETPGDPTKFQFGPAIVPGFLLQGTAMNKTSKPTTLVQIKLPAEIVKQIDTLAHRELISRTAWVRRLVKTAASLAA